MSVYLDYNSTTPLCDTSQKAFIDTLQLIGNPSSVHSYGRKVRSLIDKSRYRLSKFLEVNPQEIIFTSGGTESCNLAIFGITHHYPDKKHLITCSTEHHAVLKSMEFLKNYHGYDVTFLPVDKNGIISSEDLESAIRTDTLLCSIMMANNETGVIQNISEFGEICHKKNVFFHTDAVQAFGKIPCIIHKLNVDAFSAASHKFYGPQGAGFLWLNSKVKIESLLHGGVQENLKRPGTENTAAIVGMVVAAEYSIQATNEKEKKISDLREYLWQNIKIIYPKAVRNSKSDITLSNTLNVSFPPLDGVMLLIGLDLEGIATSNGSACMAGSIESSSVLLSMGLDSEIVKSAIRFSLGNQTTKAEIDETIYALKKVIFRQKKNYYKIG